MNLKEYIKSLVRQQVDEMSTTAGVPGVLSKNFINPGGKNKATKQAEEEGWKVTKGETEMPGDSKFYDYRNLTGKKKKKVKIYQESWYDQPSEYGAPSKYGAASEYSMGESLEDNSPKHKIIAQIMGPNHPLAKKPEREWSKGEYELFNNIMKQAKTGKIPKMNEAPEQNKDNKGKRYIPDQFEFPEFLLKPITVGREEPRVYFKIVSKGDESVLLIDPLIAVALGGIERGRTSFDKQQDLSALTRFLSDKMPSSVRGLVKKYSTGADIQSNGFMALPLIMSKKLMSGPSTKNSIVTINDKGINVLKAIKANPSKAEGFEDELQFLVYLYKNKETTPAEYADAVGVSSMLASRVANTLNKQGAVDMEAVQDTGVEGDTWYIRNPFKAKTIPGINTPLYESLKNVIKEELISEVTYHKFKNEVKFRTKNEQLHKAIREVKRKLSEIDRIVEYTSRMKQELSEGEEGIKYWRVTEKYVGQIAETINQLSNKIKNLQQ
jgi:hypothetical protein